LWNFIVPFISFSSAWGCGGISAYGKILGSAWMAAGIAFGAWKTKGFREPLSFDAPAEVLFIQRRSSIENRRTLAE
jgi:hypothetical protein